MAKFEREFKGDFEEVLQNIHYDIMDNEVSMRFVDEYAFLYDSVKGVVLVYDRYFAKTKTKANLTVTITSSEDDICVCAIGSGGGSGLLFDFSLKSKDDILDMVLEILDKHKYFL